jgi:hypothetical protein
MSSWIGNKSFVAGRESVFGSYVLACVTVKIRGGLHDVAPNALRTLQSLNLLSLLTQQMYTSVNGMSRLSLSGDPRGFWQQFPHGSGIFSGVFEIYQPIEF